MVTHERRLLVNDGSRRLTADPWVRSRLSTNMTPAWSRLRSLWISRSVTASCLLARPESAGPRSPQSPRNSRANDGSTLSSNRSGDDGSGSDSHSVLRFSSLIDSLESKMTPRVYRRHRHFAAVR